MLNDLFIQDYSYRLVKNDHQINLSKLDSEIESLPLKSEGKIVGHFIDLEIDFEKEIMPSRKALKLMRKDSIASFLTASEIIKNQSFDELELDNLNFFVINGNCLDQVQEEIGLVAKAFLENSEKDISQRNASLQTMMPPLFALKVLTNGTQSVISQELNIRGDSTTMGNTSHAFFDSCSQLSRSVKSKALISCSTGAGLYTLFNHQRNFKSKNYLLSLCASSILLSSHGPGAKAKITELDSKKIAPQLSKEISISDFSWVKKQDRANIAIYTGTTATDFNQKQINKLKEISLWKNIYDLSQSYGYLGTSSMALSISAALDFFKEGQETTVDIINIDPYGKESLIKLERVSI